MPQDLLRRFDLPHFRRVAAVVVGEPPESFKVKVRAAVLAEKQDTGRVSRYDLICNNCVTCSLESSWKKSKAQNY